jgi:hypothetical protein
MAIQLQDLGQDVLTLIAKFLYESVLCHRELTGFRQSCKQFFQIGVLVFKVDHYTESHFTEMILNFTKHGLSSDQKVLDLLTKNPHLRLK